MDLITVQAFFQQGMFNIPNYQRGYAWQHQQVKEFLEDLVDATEGSVREHYTGTITIIEKGHKEIFPKNFKLFDVVDGQQRFTTFTIFVHAIHNRFKALKVEKDVLNDIIKNIIYQENPILTLNSDSNDFYKKYIINDTVSNLPANLENKSQTNLANAKRQISRFLESYKDLGELQTFYSCLMTKFKVNFYTLAKDSDVGVVFETMNNRGLSLTQIDKVKNYLIFLSARLNNDKLSDYINNAFGNIFKEMMKINSTVTQENDILRYSHIIYRGINESDVHAQIKSDLKKDCKKEDIINYVDFLLKVVVIYSKIMRNDFANSEVRTLIKKIVWLGNHTNFIPLLIALLNRYKETQLLEVLRILEVFSFRVYKIGNRKAQAAQTTFHKLAFEIYSEKATLRQIEDRLYNNDYATEQNFKLALQSVNFANDQESDEISYFFFEYERYLHQQKQSDFPLQDFDSFCEDVKVKRISVEHIEPQNPLNRDPSKHVHKLGNLTLTYNNTILSNKEFNAKKEIYKKSKLIVEHDIVQYRTWDDSQINIRSKELIDFATKRWKF
ncbi:MAG: DUF262 domain-containing HNH endonuclease family protein [Spirosomaceae bacterium]|jgi:uncharacterized protein with ParB-like and HNH nuclease domain|nr:DUF262 domain-containing HNH endonuclease family protein [Spirosomataceae bacterium]